MENFIHMEVDNNELRLLERTWVGQGDGRSLVYIYQFQTENEVVLLSSSQKIEGRSLILSKRRTDAYYSHRYDYDQLYFIVHNKLLWRTSRFALGLLLVVAGFYIRKKLRLNDRSEVRIEGRT